MLNSILAGVTQKSVLAPVMYNLLTSDVLQTPQTMTGTFADDTVILYTLENTVIATQWLENHQNLHQD